VAIEQQEEEQGTQSIVRTDSCAGGWEWQGDDDGYYLVRYCDNIS
jgi:hypothetical protein